VQSLEWQGNKSIHFNKEIQMNEPAGKSDFVHVNSLRLHYMDWGGSGEALLFLAGMGCNAHIFGDLAPRFTDKFHVLALTRRGHGESDHPDAGYDADTLVEDILQFLEALHIEKVILAGHSMAHVELSHFAVLHPDRVIKLIYLDAAYDRSSPSYKKMLESNPLLKIQPPGLDVDYFTVQDYLQAEMRAHPALAAIQSKAMQEQSQYEVMKSPEGKIIDRMSEAIGQALANTLKNYVPEEAGIYAPVLGIFSISNGSYYISDDWMSDEQKSLVRDFFENENKAWIQENIELFKRNLPHSRLLVLPEGHHYCFIRREAEVYQAMKDFLLS
jgi:pimeloyl-ACP methyl ester carboxylesterase